MKFKNIKWLLSAIIASLTLSSCFLDKWVDDVLKEESLTDQVHADTGESIDLLRSAFNGKCDDLPTYETPSISSGDGYQIMDINNNITDLDYNEGCTPSVGFVKGLVIPIDFSDAPAKVIENGKVDPEWESVSLFYYKSSYGKLNMTFDVMDWYTMSKPSTYYENLKMGYLGEVPGVSAIINEVMRYYSTRIDLSQYDSNNDNIIDALYIIYSHEIDYYEGNFWWAYQYYTFEEKTYNSYSTYPYIFAGFDFLIEDNQQCNTHTYIHETAHLFGIEDYYDSDFEQGKTTGGLGGADLMDYTIGDHNGFTKMSLGWIDKAIVITTTSSTTLDLPALQNQPMVVLYNNNFDIKKGMFQSVSYYMLEYYTNSNLHTFDSIFSNNGIRLLRINGMLTTFNSSGTSYQNFKYNNSTTSYNLIDTILPDGSEYKTRNYTSSKLVANDSDLFIKNSVSPLTVASGKNLNKLNYQFKVNSLTTSSANITFTYRG